MDETLRKILEENTQNGLLAMRRGAFEAAGVNSDAIAQLYSEYLPDNGPLAIRIEPLETIPNGIRVRGSGQAVPFLKVGITAEFTIVGGEFRVALEATAADGWTLAESFPALRSSLADKVELRGTQVLRFRTHDGGEGKPQGLSFAGAFAVAGPLEALGQIFPEQAELTVEGRIGMTRGVPVMELRAAGRIAVDLGYFRGLAFAFTLCSRVVEPKPRRAGEEPAPYPVITAELATELEFEAGSGTIRLPLKARYEGGRNQIALAADLQGIVDASLAQIQKLLRGSNLSDQLPFPLENAIRLTDLALEYDLRQRKLLNVGIGLTTTKVWTVVPDLVEIRKIGFFATVFDPLGTPSAHLELMGEVRLGRKGDIELSTAFPDWVARGALAEDAEINLTELAEHFGIAWPGLPQVKIESLEFETRPLKKEFRGEGSIDFGTGLELGFFGLSLKALSLEINKPENGDLSGKIQGRLDLGEVTFYVGGAYDEENGFSLKGRQEPGSPLTLRAVLRSLPEGLKVELPAEFPEISISDIEVSFETKRRQLSFKATTAVEGGALEAVKIEAVRGTIDVTVGDGKVSGRLTGNIEILEPKATFKVDFAFPSATEQTLIVSYETQDEPLTLSGISPHLGEYFRLEPSFQIPPPLDSGLYRAKLTLKLAPTRSLHLEGRFRVLDADFHIEPSRVSAQGLQLHIAQREEDESLSVNGILNGLGTWLGFELPEQVPTVEIRLEKFAIDTAARRVEFAANTKVDRAPDQISLAQINGQVVLLYENGALDQSSRIGGTLKLQETTFSLDLRLGKRELVVAMDTNGKGLRISQIVALLEERTRPDPTYRTLIPAELDVGVKSLTFTIGLGPFRFDFDGEFLVFNSEFRVETNYQRDEGLTFKLTQTGDDVVLGDVVNALGKVIGGFELPAEVPRITTKLEELSLQTKKKDLVFKASTRGSWKGMGVLDVKDFSGRIDLQVANGMLKEGSGVFGDMTIGRSVFESSFKFAKLEFEATMRGDEHDLDVADLLALLQVEGTFTIPDSINFKLREASFQVHLLAQTMLLKAKIGTTDGQPEGFGFVAVTRKGAPRLAFVFGLGLTGGLRLSNIPLIGEQLRSLDAIRFEHIALLTSTQPLTDFKLPQVDDRQVTVARGVSLDAMFAIGELQLPFTLTIYSPRERQLLEDGENPINALTEGESESTGKIRWIKLDRKISVLRLQRLGVQFHQGRIRLILDGGLTAGGLQLDLYALSLAFKPTGNLSDVKPEIGLDGIYIAFAKGGVDVRGGFLRTPNPHYPDRWLFTGEAALKIGSSGFAAMGSYTSDDKGIPSLFLYGYLGIPFGKPEFYVKGLAAGFGFNRRVVTPQIDKVRSWPLVDAALGRSGETGGRLTKLNETFPQASGNVWIAAGIRFSSFEVLNAFGLVVLSGGTHFEATVLAIGGVDLPPNAGSEVLGRIEMAIQATVSLNEGRFYFAAAFTENSYILVKEAKLEGGLAFVTWLWGPHAGEAVLTMGGYHPQFTVPAHYPRMSRLGFSVKLEEFKVTIKGNRYFALTPSCFMLGGMIEASFSYRGFEAWLRLQFDALISWMPFAFRADAVVSIGISYTIAALGNKKVTISAEAKVALWGPEFAGEVTVELRIVSFTFRFGKTVEVPTISWDEFCRALLTPPPPSADNGGDSEGDGEGLAGFERASVGLVALEEPLLPRSEICRAWVAEGMVKEVRRSDEEQTLDGWVLDPGKAAAVVSTKIPVKQAIYNGVPVTGGWTTAFGVGMVGVAHDDFSSQLTVAVSQWLEPGNYVAGFKIVVPEILGSSPKAMWQPGAPQLSDAGGEAAKIADTLTELRVTTEAIPGGALPPVSREALAVPWREPIPLAAPQPRPVQEPITDKNPRHRMESTIQAPVEDRVRILQLLTEQGLPVPTEVRVSGLATGAHDLLAAPQLVTWESET